MTTPTTTQKLLTEREAARYLNVSQQFLRKARMDGARERHARGPRFVKAGRMVRYAVEDLDAWITQHQREVHPLGQEHTHNLDEANTTRRANNG